MERQPATSSGLGINAILFFGFGLAAGILTAFSGLGFLQDGAALIATVFMAALMVVLLLGVILYAARRMIWSRLFGFAEVQIEQLANPLASVAERAIAGDPAGATMAARDLVALALARYSWVTTRRWIIASLTALIAAMAALAGTALLFQQNQLLAVQSGLLVEQNAKIADQTALLSQQTLQAAQQVQLAEAERNAQLAVEITGIAASLGAVLDTVAAEVEVATGQPATSIFNAIQTSDLSRELVLRITSVSRATKPYRFLDLGIRPQSEQDNLRIAIDRRRAELPNTYARIGAYYGWTDPATEAGLIDRPASPERGQLLSVLLGAGLRNLEPLTVAGLDLSYAHMRNADVILMTAQGGRLESADFSGSHFVGGDLGGAVLNNMRCLTCVIEQTDFSQVQADRLLSPWGRAVAPMSTRANGIDFAGATLDEVSFANAELMGANFDGSLLIQTDFSGARLGVATLRGAILMAPVWGGTNLKSTDFDGAILFGADPLADLVAADAGDTFNPDRFRADPIDRATVLDLVIVKQRLSLADVDRITGKAQAWRLTRVQLFDDGLPP